ncbi:hypothetical protein [Halobaculum gomorrense]|uniref:NPCBM-associated, NEW3 domain of alpha-galactosidase n=1 Tax=Halobaculum gomorrense TaxID=43928 RepID=A0A1M5NUB7_9EURY|nr:hypothetical protein [Halobaculum gomorrense]SHG93156.1 hypothetical protein SAMN05443636_1350 [Halobaculum gomorrense]
MTRTSSVARLLALAFAVVVVLGAATPAIGVQTTVETDAALTDQTVTDELSFTFTADSNGTVDATQEISRANGNVTFAFDSWERVGGGASGTSSSWEVVAGEEYRVTYEVTVTGSVSEQTYSGTAQISGATSASEQLEVYVDVLYPEFGVVDTGDPKLVFDNPNSQSQTTTFDVTVPNTGNGAMVLSDVSFSSVPADFTVDAVSIPDTIGANDEGDVGLEVTADDSVSAGTYSFTMTLEDNLGNTRDVSVSVDVVKPPIVSVPGDEVNVGDVLVGSSSTVDFQVEEIAGNDGIDGLTVEIIGAETDGSVSFNGLRSVSTSPGGSDTASVTMSGFDSADQHEELTWDLKVTPDAANAPSYTFTVTGRVIYPAKLERVESSDPTIPFDEPKSSTSTFQQTTEVGIVNSGDLEMTVVSADASMVTGGQYITAGISDLPNAVSGLSTGTATLSLTADDDTPEGEYEVEITVQTESAGTKTITRTVTVSQQPELSVSNSVSYGEVTITENRTQTIDVAERLGFESIENVQVKRVDGPNRWLTVVSEPRGTVAAGETKPLVVALQFDTQAELYQQYRWRFRVSGDGVETQTITVTARAKPYSFDRITEPLGQYESAVQWKRDTAVPMNEMLLTMEQRLRGDEKVPGADLSRGLAVGRATLLFVDSLDAARAAQENGSYAQAQRSLARAAVARDLMKQYAGSLEQPDLRSTARQGISAADEAFAATVADQRDHYRGVVEANKSAIANAEAHRALMRLAQYTGNDEAAQRHRAAYEDASARYRRLVDTAATRRASAESAYAAYRANATVVLAGYPLVFNPARADAALEQINRITDLYSDSAAGFRRAGATDEADATAERAATVGGRLAVSRYGLFGAIGAYALAVLLVLARVGFRTYAYVQDAEAATTGEFLTQMST